jgi:hypothetical protein
MPLVAGGHKQRPGIAFNETFAPVWSYRTLRMMLAVAEHAGLLLRQFVIKTAFLHGDLKEEVYVRPPRGWEYLTGGSGCLLWMLALDACSACCTFAVRCMA